MAIGPATSSSTAPAVAIATAPKSNVQVVKKPRDTSSMDVSVSISSQTKVEATQRTSKPPKPPKTEALKKKSVSTVDIPLPDVPHAKDIWNASGGIMHTWVHFVSTLENLWDANSTGEEMKTLHKLWAIGFPKNKEHISSETKIHKVSQQRSYDWRSRAGKKGIFHVLEFFKQQGLNTEEQRKECATKYGLSYLCMYHDDKTWQERSAAIEEAKANKNKDLTEQLELEHAKISKFSEVWNIPTTSFIQGINKLSKRAWKRTVRDARKFVTQSKSSSKVHTEVEQVPGIAVIPATQNAIEHSIIVSS
ncbi:hypothetical protein PHLCEN_2v7701 [Hermanssonia centrifuga]|uniref:Uncharacterized protein n=1 Tax=Hermanssonia centrifuga TaxID=98765 RepID=A0A2R6NVT5_9APHY|nr:hypothetical protein PHLCEN_2v7701 [Hermanssonia centrifuga]